jgi:predicted N-acetyltransferase YhbS
MRFETRDSMSEAKVEIAYLSDHPELIAILAAWFQDEWGYMSPGSSIEDVKGGLRQQLHLDELPLALVALSGAELVGSASLRPFDLKTRKDLSPWLSSVYVPLEHRDKGIGSKLVQAAEAKAARLGIKTLHLYTPDKESFYARLGWSTLEWTEYGREQVVIMKKRLSHSLSS